MLGISYKVVDLDETQNFYEPFFFYFTHGTRDNAVESRTDRDFVSFYFED